MDHEVEDYLDKEDENISQSGLHLLEFVEACGEKIRLPLTTQLFPYLFMASRKMTTRELSAWLLENEGIKLSSASIAKGIKRPDLHLQRIAEFVQYPANFLAALYDYDPEALLFEDHPVKGVSYLDMLSDNINLCPDPPSPSVRSSLKTLLTIWKPIPVEMKYMCRRFFDFGSDATKEDDAGEDNDSPTATEHENANTTEP